MDGWKYGFGTGGDGTGDADGEVAVWQGPKAGVQSHSRETLGAPVLKEETEIWGEGRVRWQRDQESHI